MAHIQKKTYRSTRTGKIATSWQARYTAPDGRERTRRFRRKVDAQTWIEVNGGDVARGDWLDPADARILFREWIELWVNTTVNLRDSTKERDLGYVHRYILPTFGYLTLGQIEQSPMLIQAWVANLTTSGPPPWWDTTDPENEKRKVRSIAPATAVKAAQLLDKIMTAAVKVKKIRSNPCDFVELPKVERHEMRFLTAAEVDTLAVAINPRYKALVLVGAYGGLRIAELAGLRRGRIDILKGRVEVAEIVIEVKDEGAGRLRFGPPKTKAARRFVTLPRSIIQILNDHLADYTAADPDALVFTGPEGGPLRVSLWRQRFWKKAVANAGLSPLTPHDLRHTAVAIWIATGANVLEVSRRAGHTSVAFTLDRYGHLFPGADDAVADRLETFFLAAASERVDESITDIRSKADGRMTDDKSKSTGETALFVAPDLGKNEWALEDSNLRPQPCEGCALTS